MSPIRLHQLHRIIRRDDRLHLPALNLGKVRREKQVAHLELPNKRMGIIWSVHEQIVGENVRKPSSKCGRVVRVRDGVEEGVGRGVRSRAEDAEDGSGRPSAGFVVAGGYPEVEVDLKNSSRKVDFRTNLSVFRLDVHSIDGDFDERCPVDAESKGRKVLLDIEADNFFPKLVTHEWYPEFNLCEDSRGIEQAWIGASIG